MMAPPESAAMQTQDIPIDQWPTFFDQFSRAHRGQPAAVTTEDLTLGLQSDGQGLPFIGIIGAGPPEDQTVRVMIGDGSGAHVDHSVQHPSRIWVAEWNDGFSAALQIKSNDGRLTLVQIGPVQQLLPEGVITDGIVR